MTRCILCDWSPTQNSLCFIAPTVPQRLNNKNICNVCEDIVLANLNSITPKEKEDEE